MSKRKEFIIPFVGLKLGKHQFEYQINSSFFEIFDFNEFEKSAIKVKVVLEKKANLLELDFKHKGTVQVPCDQTGEEFDLPIKGKIKLIVRFGETFNNDNEELLILPYGEFEIDIAQYIYEMIVLSVPLRRVHPGVKDGTLQTETLEKLKNLTASKEVKEKNTEQVSKDNIDPRWDKLKQLLTDK
ncbi:YceD family protein [Flavobacterium sp. TSSA_36]|uniref:YceD family protein n=1 Tax=Flavobacterium sp. TSSA_36 TaxID=3447669 RepID=UPI003F335618